MTQTEIEERIEKAEKDLESIKNSLRRIEDLINIMVRGEVIKGCDFLNEFIKE